MFTKILLKIVIIPLLFIISGVSLIMAETSEHDLYDSQQSILSDDIYVSVEGLPVLSEE